MTDTDRYQPPRLATRPDYSLTEILYALFGWAMFIALFFGLGLGLGYILWN